MKFKYRHNWVEVRLVLILTSLGVFTERRLKGASEVQEMFYILVMGCCYMSVYRWKSSLSCMGTEDFFKAL